MADDETDRRINEQTSPIYARSFSAFLAMHGISGAYGQLVVRSALLLNGGALFAMPAFLAAILGPERTRAAADAVLWSASFYIGGIVTAALCSFIAYANYQAAANQFLTEGHSQVLDIQERYDDTTFHRSKNWRDEYRLENRKQIRFLEGFAKWTTWVAVVVGFISYLCFVLGCYQVGSALIV